jgi:uncharacterized membrane protein
MPFCIQCGSKVGDADQFCELCGAKQDGSNLGGFAAAGAGRSGAAEPKPGSDFLPRVSDRTASTLCYVPYVGWVASIIVLAADRFREVRNVRFHAFQGLYLFVLYLFVDWVFEPIARSVRGARVLAELPFLVLLGTWIFMMVKTGQGSDVRLPVLGELADRSVAEQK